MNTEAILQAVRAWFQVAATHPGPQLELAQVLLAEEEGPRPPLPYATVLLSTPEIQIGVDELIHRQVPSDDTAVEYQVRGIREAIVEVQTFGPTALDWVRNAGGVHLLPTVDALLRSLGLVVVNIGQVRNITRFLDTGQEQRYAREMVIRYEFLSGIESAAAVASIQIAQTPPDMTYTVQIPESVNGLVGSYSSAFSDAFDGGIAPPPPTAGAFSSAFSTAFDV